MNVLQIVREVLETEAKEILKASKKIDKDIEKAVDIIYNTKGKLIVTGVGKSGLVGAKMAATFASTGTSSFFLHPTEALHGDLGMIGKDDAVLAISYSGESEELSKILPHIKRFDIKLIGMTKDKNSTLGKYSDVVVPISVEKEACPLNIVPTSSTTLTMALGDAIAVALMKKRDFKKEDFASFHPGGALGRRLYVKAKDLMRKENLPIVNEDTTLKDALFEMTRGRIGNVIITDEDGVLKGVLSDGDLRRAMMRDDFSMDDSVMKYASKSPKFLDDDEILASDVLKIIEDFKLQHMVFTDKEKRVKGVLHIHDLIEAGIK
ncbi:MAG: KpsF/GutQ family sugar-phosphate isomerase [Epsilonproteobacteria bacterium]|nr:KpsF/GutQ family sugar-phosphate isomerase [Campylobacterota bacterium]